MSADADVSVPEPTAAEQVRSVLARAVSLSLGTDSQDYDLIGMHTVAADGRITLHPQPGTPLAAQVATAGPAGLAAVLEFTDIAATPLRERVRTRVTVLGRLVPGRPHGEALALDMDRITLSSADGTQDVAVEAFTRATPDPLAVEEAAMLTHLADAHDDMVAGLLALGGSRLPQGMLRALPFAIDRFGITLRCEYREGHCDLRLPFRAVARDSVEAGEEVRQLLSIPVCPHRRRSSVPPGA